MTTTHLLTIARSHGREYITPEDITEAIDARHPIDELAWEFISAIDDGDGIEDRSLCAFELLHSHNHELRNQGLAMTTRPCRMCGATIALIRTPAGKTMPVNAEPRVTIVTDDGQVVTGRTPHWATCPHSDLFWRSK